MSVYIVAEIGSNHCQDLGHAKHLIRDAARAGANAVKFQLWDADKMYPQGTPEHASATKWQLHREWVPILKAECDTEQVDFMCTAFDFDSLDFIDPFVKTHKIASIESTWEPFVKAVVEKGKPLFISNGMNRRTFPVYPVDGMVQLVCVVSYPARIEDYNLRQAEGFGGWPWGVSDHTTDPLTVPMTAVALGATVVEKHIRGLTCDSPDADHAINDREFAQMVRGIRNVEKALGSSEKRILPSEEPNLKYRRGPLGLRGA